MKLGRRPERADKWSSLNAAMSEPTPSVAVLNRLQVRLDMVGRGAKWCFASKLWTCDHIVTLGAVGSVYSSRTCLG